MRLLLVALALLLSFAVPALPQSGSNKGIFDAVFFAAGRSGGLSNLRHEVILITGRNESIGNNVPETVWPPGAIRPKPSGLTSLEIVSDSLLDTLAGTGCQVFGLNGLGIDGAEIAQLISMNGTSAAAVPTQLFRIQPSGCAQPGSLRVNDGNISIQESGGGTVFGFISAGKGGGHTAAFTVPKDTVFILTGMTFSTKDDFASELITDVPSFGLRTLTFEIQGQIQIPIEPPVCYPSATELEHQAVSTSGNASITSMFSGWLVEVPGGLCPN